ncbi:hypothetical protein [Streptomyces sp. NPDC048428]|uniref:hypothetical protein n=1 Tax=Streptomyces sp. NPDC048428 TaxID=3154503 RepID=UPI00341F0D0D
MNRTPETSTGADPDAQATALIAAVEAAVKDVPTAYRDTTPLPVIGAAAPVAQPGRPPMSQRATDASSLMLAGGAGTLMAGTGAGVALWALGSVDPLTLGIAAGGPVALLAALSLVLRRAGQAAAQAAPVTHNHTYTGPVRQEHRTTTTTTRGVIARTRNGR